MFINIIAVFFLVTLASILGYKLAWSTRGRRIDSLEELLNSATNKMAVYEQQIADLEASETDQIKKQESFQSEIQRLHSEIKKEKGIVELIRNEKSLTLLEIDNLQKSVAYYKEKLYDLHIKFSSSSINLRKANEEKINWELKYNRLFKKNSINSGAFNVQERLVPKKSLINTLVPKKTKRKKKTISQHEDILAYVERRKSELDFDNIGQAYSIDNLQVLDGLGAMVEKKLNKLGIYSIAQMASLDENSIKLISQITGVPENRFQNGKWVEIAKTSLGIDDSINIGKKLNAIAGLRKYLNTDKMGIEDMKNSNDLSKINTLLPFDIAKLNALGIYRLEQIARFGPIEIKNATNALSLTPDRIKNEYWVEQAKEYAALESEKVNTSKRAKVSA